jgi:hypothetical protein
VRTRGAACGLALALAASTAGVPVSHGSDSRTVGAETASHRGGGPSAARPWGASGHEMAARAAHATLPAEMPPFFRDAGDQLAYLNAEPDRWRDGSMAEMAEAWAYDHYIDLEIVPEGALEAPDRFAYLRALYQAGLARPERDAGLLPFRILELYQRLVTEWRLWGAAADPSTRRWSEARIIDDAGILGHYVTDGSQPQHTTIHFNGWSGGAANPEGYTEDRTFHARFESDFVAAHVTRADVERRVARRPASVAHSARSAILDYMRDTHAQVERLYRLDRDVGFDPSAAPRSATVDFAAERLGAGASMLAVLWVSAWEESGS